MYIGSVINDQADTILKYLQLCHQATARLVTLAQNKNLFYENQYFYPPQT